MADLPNNQALGTVRTLYAYTKHGYVRIAKAIKAMADLPNNQACPIQRHFCSQVRISYAYTEHG